MTDPDPGVPPPRVPPAWALAASVIGFSWAAPLVRFSDAPALAIASWRLVLSAALVGGVLGLRAALRPRSGSPSRPIATHAAVLLSGVLLAAHFWAWIESVQRTSVASSAFLVSLSPFLAAGIAAVFLGERAARGEWTGIAIAFAGAVVIAAGGGGGAGVRSASGDLLALASALFVAAHAVLGRSLRRSMDLWDYVTRVYGIAAVLLVLAAAGTGTPLGGYPAREWWVFAALAAGPMMLGHTGMNYALRYVPAHVANLAALAEPVGATLLAWALPAIAETPPPQALVGGALILAGFAVTARARRGASPPRHGRRPEGRPE